MRAIEGATDRTMRSPTAEASGPTRRNSGARRVRASRTTFVASDRYLEQEVIGRGGMSIILRAYDSALDRDVALKLIPPEYEPTDSDIVRLQREARVMAHLDHPTIVPIYDSRIDEYGVAFISMKLVGGDTLEDTLNWAASFRLDPEFLGELLEVFLKACDGVAFAHRRGVLHLDLKPSNVMIGDFGRVYVIDWGVAQPARQDAFDGNCAVGPVSDRRGLIVGTPHYMAPEQLNGLPELVSERTDVFGLGGTLYEILTGEPPRDLERPIAFGGAFQVAPPETIVGEGVVPAALSRIALKALAHEPADRYPSVEAMAGEVRQFLATLRSTWPARSDAFDGDRPHADAKLLRSRSSLDDVGRVEDARGAELFSDTKDVNVEPLCPRSKVA
jgi:serine/threonine-protein kinase